MQSNPSQPSTPELQQYFIIKHSVQLPPKISLIFSIFQKIIQHPNDISNSSTSSLSHSQTPSIGTSKQNNKQFVYAFSKLAIDEQSKFLNAIMKYTVKCLMKKQEQVIPKDSQIRNIETSVQVYSTYLKIPVWHQFDFKLDKSKKTVVLSNKKKMEVLDLHDYLVRRSKKFKGCIVLQGANSYSKSQPKKYILSFKPNLGEQIYEQLFDSIITIKQQQLEKIIMGCLPQCQSQSSQKLIHSNSPLSQAPLPDPPSSMVFLSSKNINQFLNYKESIMKSLITTKFDFKKISNPQRKQYKIQQSTRNDKIFKLQGQIQHSIKQTKIQFLNNLGNMKNKIIISCQILQNFSNKYMAVYEKFLFANKIQELITIREHNLSDQEDVLFVKGMDNIMVKNFIQFLLVKIKPVANDQCKIVILCSIQLDQLITTDRVKLYLYTLWENCKPKKIQKLLNNNPLNPIQEQETYVEKTKVKRAQKQVEMSLSIKPYKMKQQKNQHDSQDKKQRQQEAPTPKQKSHENIDYSQGFRDQFHTVCGFGPEQQYMEFVEGEQQIKNPKLLQMTLQKIQANNTIYDQQNAYLKHRFELAPKIGYKKHEDLMTQHYLFKDWVRRKDGGVLCKNQELVNNQKRMFKDLISRIGSNFMKNASGVMNISLPVIVFKKQSHLQSIARDFCFAPLFFENLHDKLQRVKYAALLAISVGTLGISMQKPFNPLLGQTYQGWIGGCPIYLQQISHHPPIGSYYMIGRGYKIYGKIQPKISFGMNNVKGFSQQPNCLVFDDGTEIQMSYGKMIIHGMLFGQRQFNYEDKIFAYDKKNNIFAQINYGPRKKSMLGKSSQPWDFVYGHIYQLTQDFLQYFNNTHPRPFPSKQHIVKELSEFQGIWNQSIYFDKKEYVNFKKQLPCQPHDEKYPLPSNSLYRQDLLKLIQNDLQNAQQQKEIIEEMQRRDRKLRQEYKKKNMHLFAEVDEAKRQKIKKSFTK